MIKNQIVMYDMNENKQYLLTQWKDGAPLEGTISLVIREEVYQFLNSVCDVTIDMEGTFFEFNSKWYKVEPFVKNRIKEAVQTLCAELQQDPDYYMSWQANMAMAFVDGIAFRNLTEAGEPVALLSKREALEIANQAAKNFLNLLISK